MPVADGDFQPFLHPLAQYHTVFVIHTVCKLVAGVGTFEAYGFNRRKQAHDEYSTKMFLRSRYSRVNVGRRAARREDSAASGATTRSTGGATQMSACVCGPPKARRPSRAAPNAAPTSPPTR